MKTRLRLGIMLSSIIFACILPTEKRFFASEPPRSFLATCTMGGRAGEKSQVVVNLELSEDGMSLHYKLEVHGLKDITMAHIHIAKPGETTTPVVWLYPPSPPPKLIPGEFKGVLAEGTIGSKNLVGPLRGKPLSALLFHTINGNALVNIHTRANPRGEICGRIEHLPDEGRHENLLKERQ